MHSLVFPYFKSTRWTIVRQLQDPDETKAKEALSLLCETYWNPIYAFIRRSGSKAQDAEDLTQGFFCHLLEKNSLASADPAKGKLRSFLLACLKNYLGDQHDRSSAKKRGAALLVPFDSVLAEECFRDETVDHLSPDLLFQRRWALSSLEKSMKLLEEEFADSNKEQVFAALKPFLGFGPEPEKRYDEIAVELGIPVGTLKSQVHRLRERWCVILFEQVGMTLENPSPENIKSELQELLGYV